MKKIFTLVLALMMALSACSFAAAESTVSTDGSTSMEKVIGALGEYFMDGQPGRDRSPIIPPVPVPASTAVQERHLRHRPVHPRPEGRGEGRRPGGDRGGSATASPLSSILTILWLT